MSDSKTTRLRYSILAPESRARMILARRQFRMAYMRRAAAPFSGPYYWIPLPDGKWEPVTFPDKFYRGQAAHVRVWPEVVNILALKWSKEPEKLERRLQNSPYALPRGRVVLMGNRQWGIAHGDDTPTGFSLAKIRREFYLPRAAREFYDCHEVMMSEHMNSLKKILGNDFGLQEPPAPDFGDDEGS